MEDGTIMDEYVVAAAESLMVDYRNSFIEPSTHAGDVTFLEWYSALQHAESWLTPTQRLLKIPLPLAVAAVLSECATEAVQQCHRNEVFQRLQRIWFLTSSTKRSKKPPKYFEWSPTLLLQRGDDDANEPLRQQFRDAIDQRCAVLEQRALQATQELLQWSTAVTKPRPTHRSTRHVVVPQPTSSDVDDDTTTASDSSLEEDENAIAPLSHDFRNDCDEYPSTVKWTQVRRKGEPKPSDEVLRSEEVEIPSQHAAVSEDIKEEIEHSVSGDVLLEAEEELISTDVGVDSPQSTSQLEQRIQHLERQLVETEQQLVEERAAAKKQLQSETHVLHERIQALQLRLYISETRLQTYEEALRQHVESVAENTASPGRRPIAAAETPPLYARGR